MRFSRLLVLTLSAFSLTFVRSVRPTIPSKRHRGSIFDHKNRHENDVAFIRELIRGGNSVVDAKEFDFFAMFSLGNARCGGALVSPYLVLTSALCLQSVFGNSGPSTVLVGSLNDLTGTNKYNVQCVVTHPNFSVSGTRVVADLAMVKLLEKVPANVATPIRGNGLRTYPEREAISGGSSTLRLIGAGAEFVGGVPSSTLQELSVKYDVFSACQSDYNGELTEAAHFCAGGTLGKGACIGDQGSPLLGVDPEHVPYSYVLAGIYSFSDSPCGTDTKPDVYTRISTYATWIEQYVSNGVVCPSTPTPTEAPAPAPAPVPDSSCLCFSETATTEVLGQGTVLMKDLQVGQKIFAGYKYNGNTRTPQFETVYGFGHHEVNKTAGYLRITVDSFADNDNNNNNPTREGTRMVKPLEISRNHLIFVPGQSDPVRADSLQIGDNLLYNPFLGKDEHASSSVSKQQQVVITNIETIQQKGLYQPLTKDGTIIVNGIYASTYVSLDDIAPRVVEACRQVGISEQTIFHWYMAPYRFVCTKVAPNLCVNDYSKEEGFIHWLVLGRYAVEYCQKYLSTVLLVTAGVVVLLFCGFVWWLDSILEGSLWAILAASIAGTMLFLCVSGPKNKRKRTKKCLLKKK